MADGDHCRSIMYYEDPAISNRRMVPATHYEQRGDAFVPRGILPYFQDNNRNEELNQAERPMEQIVEDEEPYRPAWPVLPLEPLEEPQDFLLYDFDDTEDSDERNSDMEDSDFDESYLEVNDDEDKEVCDDKEADQNSVEGEDKSIPGISKKRDGENDGEEGKRSIGGFCHDDDSSLDSFLNQPTASVQVVERDIFKDREKWADCTESEVNRNPGAEEDIEKNPLPQGSEKRARGEPEGEAEEAEEKEEEEEKGSRYFGHDHDCILENF